MDLAAVMFWVPFYAASMFAFWQAASRATESRMRRKVDSAERRLEQSISETCNLRGEIGALRNRLSKALAENLSSARRAHDAAYRMGAKAQPRADDVYILGGVDITPVFEDTQRLTI